MTLYSVDVFKVQKIGFVFEAKDDKDAKRTALKLSQEGEHEWEEYDRTAEIVNTFVPLQGVNNEEPFQEDCGSCGAMIGKSSEYPWHGADEDCRAIKQPKEAKQNGG